jgi:hypothetical protein
MQFLVTIKSVPLIGEMIILLSIKLPAFNSSFGAEVEIVIGQSIIVYICIHHRYY